MICKCGTTMDDPIETPNGLLEYKCPACRRSVVRANKENPRRRVQGGAGKRVLKWV